MLVGFLVSLIIFLDLPDIKDALVSEGIIWAEVQYGDCYSQATTQTETGSGQTGLVFAPSWYPTFEFLEIATDLPSAQCPSVKFLSSIALAMTTVNRDPRKCRVCKQLHKSSAMYCNTCHEPWQNVIDQSYVHGSKKSQQNDQGQYCQTPWQGQQDWQAHWQSTSARGRTPSPRQRQRPKSAKGNKTPKNNSRLHNRRNL